MRKILLTLILMLKGLFVCRLSAHQDYRLEGTNFVQQTSKSSNNDIQTKYTYEVKGTKYPIYLSKNGKAYIVRKSQKTGNEYKQYLDKEISDKLAKEYNITVKQ